MIIVFIIIFIISLVLAWRSMGDFDLPSEVKKLVSSRKIKGTIIFLKNKVIFYRHHSSSSSSDDG
ncbi:MAG: hypothetical protein ACPL1D_01430 [Microgenomates group bacterium]